MTHLHPRLVIFDFDGTLADTIADIAGAVNRTLESHGFPEHQVEKYRLMVGNGFSALIDAVLPKGQTFDRAFIDAIRRQALEEYERHCLELTHPYPGMSNALFALVANGIQVAILSNKPDHLLQHMAHTLFPGIPFTAVWGNAEGRARKPDPKAALDLCALSGTSPMETAFVGDSGVDMQTARAAAMVPVGVLYGYRSREELVAAGAAILVEAPSDLPILFRPL